MKRLGLALGVTFLFTTSAGAVPLVLTTVLSGANENPATASLGTGFATVTIDTTAHTLTVDVTFSGLTANVTASHIHCCVTAPGNAGVATQTPTFTLFPAATAGSYLRTFDTTLAASFNPAFVTANGATPAGAEAALATGLGLGRAYLNIHTSVSPGGEIRGFLTPVPEPATLALSLTGLAALARRQLKRRR